MSGVIPSLAQWRAGGEPFRWRGHEIFVRRGGNWSSDDRPVLVLIHGFPTASWDWCHLWPELEADFRLIGFGWSDKPRHYDYSIFDQANLCEAICAHHGVISAHLLAHDYGDTVAQELLARHQQGGPLRLNSVCLLNGGLFPETHRATRAQKLLHGPLGPVVARLIGKRGFTRSFQAIFGPQTQPDSGDIETFWSLVRAGDGTGPIAHKLIRYVAERRRHRQRWLDALCKGDPPIRLICGAADPVSGAHMYQRYLELVPDPDAVLLPGIGHYPQFEAPQAVLDAFRAFQAGLRTPGPQRDP